MRDTRDLRDWALGALIAIASTTAVLVTSRADAGFTPAVGACCFEDMGSATDGGRGATIGPDDCTVITAALCASSFSGAYQGDGTTCSPNPCLPPTTTPTHTPTATPTTTPTATPTNTPLGPGAACELTTECAGGLTCVDDFCCNETCDNPSERCDIPGLEGTCTAHAPASAPAASNGVLVMIAALLLALGVFALARPRRAPR